MRRQSLLLLAAVVISVCAASISQAQQFVFDDLSDAHLRRILRGMGYDEIEVLEETEDSTSMLVTINEWKVVITNNHEEGNLVIYAFFTNEEGETEHTLELANAWNRDRRFSKVLIDDDGSWVIDADFEVETGITQEQLEAWIDVWVVRLNDFAEYLKENTASHESTSL